MTGEANGAHLRESIRWMINSPKEARIQKANQDIWVSYPIADRIFKAIDNMVKIPRGIQSPCLLVSGKSGAGKSCIIDQLKKKYRHKKSQSLAFISLGDNPTNKSIKDKISEALGFPPGLNYSQPDRLPPELFCAIRQRNVRGIVIDELNDALLVSKAEQRRNMSFFKGLGNKENGLCVFGFGTPHAFNAISSDEQLARRFYQVELSQWAETEEFRGFLYGIESTIPLRAPSQLYDQEKARYILLKSKGLMCDVVRIIRSAACHAISNDLDQITMDMLECGFFEPWLYGGE